MPIISEVSAYPFPAGLPSAGSPPRFASVVAAPVPAAKDIAAFAAIVPPARGKSRDAWPVSDAVIFPAAKLFDASRATIVDAVLLLVASVEIVLAAEPL